MGIGWLTVDDKFEESYTALDLDDVLSGCRLTLRDNAEPVEVSITLTVKSAQEMRDYLDRYIKEYMGELDDEE